MQVEVCESIRRVIDKSLVATASQEEERMLDQHFAGCDPCREYQQASQRVIAGLKGFSFDVNPELHGRVTASLTMRAQQLQGTRIKHSPMGWSYFAAFVLTVAGSLAALQFSGLAVAVFHLEPAPLHFGVLALWIVPSWFCCLLFPLLHRLAAGRTHEKGSSQ